jgi:hypothetical protein
VTGFALDQPRTIISLRVSARRFDCAAATLAATLIPLSLIWDYSWESTVGVDRVWSPPHLLTHVAIWLSALIALRLIAACSIASRRNVTVAGIKISSLCAPPGAWIMLWGVVLFELVIPLDIWWQQAYGLGAGIWPPPQILKAASFLAIQLGALMLAMTSENNPASHNPWTLWICGMILALSGIMLGTATLPNVQHSAKFHTLCALIFPATLVVTSIAGRGRWSATLGAFAYLLVSGVMVWLLPLFPARPLTSPIHNPMDHFMPPQFPLLLILPALALDGLRRWRNDDVGWRREILFSVAAGAMFVVILIPAQWWFANFLLAPSSDNWFFAGGGRHWPFFLKIDGARVKFWITPQETVTWRTLLSALAFASASAFAGLRLGKFLKALQR